MGKAGGTAKAAGIVAAGGGPEDPVTDVIAAGELVKSGSGGAAKGAAKGAGAGADAAADQAKAKATSKGKGRARKGASWAWSDNRKLLTAQFVACVVVLGVGTLVAPSDSKHDVSRAMVKGSALAGIFFVLALVSSGGKGAARTANAIGTLITASYILTSSDVHNIATWAAAFFSPASAKEKGHSNTVADQDTEPPAGAGNDDGVVSV